MGPMCIGIVFGRGGSQHAVSSRDRQCQRTVPEGSRERPRATRPVSVRWRRAGLLALPTRYLFFTGKGGVGKTSLACATAVILAGLPGLSALNIEPEAAAAAYRERIIAPLRGTSTRDLRTLEEQMSGACTTEIAAFDEFTQLLTDRDLTGSYDHIIFDTAPAGHTLRLLQLPAAWSNFIAQNPGGASCLGPASGLQAQHAQYADTVARLSDPAMTTIVLVSRAEPSAVKEAERTRGELSTLGIRGLRLVINAVFEARDRTDPLALALEARGRAALERMPAALRSLPRDVMTVDLAKLPGR